MWNRDRGYGDRHSKPTRHQRREKTADAEARDGRGSAAEHSDGEQRDDKPAHARTPRPNTMAPGDSVTGSLGTRVGLVLVASVELAIAVSAATATATASAPAATTPAAAAAPTIPTTAAATVAATAFTAAAATTATPTTGAAVERDDVLGLRPLLTLTNLELHLLAFLELAEPAALDRGEVHEAILATIIRRDKTVALLSIEPLHYPCRAHRALSPLALCS